MKIDSSTLLAATNIIDMVPSRAGIPASEFIRLAMKKNRIFMSLSAEVYGTVSVKSDESGDWEAFVDRESFVPFIRASQDNARASFSFVVDKKGTLTVKCGRRKGLYNKVTNVWGFTETNIVKGHTLTLGGQYRKLLTLAACYATPDPTVAHLNCVYLDRKGFMLSSNEKAAIRVHAKGPKASLPLPLGVLKMLDNDQVTELELGEKLAKITFKQGYLCQVVNQKAVDKFPVDAIHKSFNTAMKSVPVKFKVETGKFVAAMLRLNSYSSVVIKRDAVVKITGTKGDNMLTLSCDVPSGHFSERIPTKSGELATDISLEWLLPLMLPLVQLPKDIMKLTVSYDDSSKVPYVISAPGMELLVSRRVSK